MALRRPEKKNLSDAAMQAITEASAQQTGKAQAIKSWDPTNFPVFDVPINQKVLIYIPNHQVQNPDGSMMMRMDKFAAHPVMDGRTFANIRCSNGIVSEELHLDGTCPFCDGMNDVWSLYNKEYADIARTKGMTTDSPEAETALKQDRIDLLNAMAIKNAEVWYTFPIIVIDNEVDDKGQFLAKPKLDSQRQLHGTPMWYSIRERTYLEKWIAGFDSLEVEGDMPTNPAGLWATLNFTYTPKSGTCDKMGSAKALKVAFKTMQNYGQWEKAFDELTEDWTPAKAAETVVLDSIRSMDEMNEAADTILKPVRDKLAMYDLQGVAGIGAAQATGVSSNADAALANFGAQEVGQPPAAVGGEMPANITGELPNTGVAQ